MLSSINKMLKGYATRNEANVLIYHGIADDTLPFPLWTQMEEKRFEQHIKYISENCRCISASELKQALKQKRLEPYTVVVTFDDGFASNFYRALPILEHYNVPATVFVSSGFTNKSKLIWADKLISTIILTNKNKLIFDNKDYSLVTIEQKDMARKKIGSILKRYPSHEIDEKIEKVLELTDIKDIDILNADFYDNFRLLNEKELQKLSSSDLIEIGAHTVNHTILSRLSDEDACEEITQSKKQLENVIGKPVTSFAYPNGGIGDYNNSHAKMLEEAGYDMVFTSIVGTVKTNSNQFDLNRIGIGSEINVNNLSYIIKGGTTFDQKQPGVYHLMKSMITGILE